MNAYSPDPTTNHYLTYTGSATVVPSTNQNPYGAGNDVTTNLIGGVEYRVDGGSWQYANAVDGTFDDPVEQFTFTAYLSDGTHTIDARAINSVTNYDPTPASDTVTVIPNTAPNKPAKPNGPAQGRAGVSYPYSTSTTDPEADMITYGWDWDGDSVVDEWTSPVASGATITTSHTWTAQGTYAVKVKAKDSNGAESPWSDPLSVTMPKAKVRYASMMERLLERFPHAFSLLRMLLNR